MSEPPIALLLGRLIAEDGPGAAVGVYRDGQLVASAVRGLACLEHGVPITVRTRFPLASVARELAAAGPHGVRRDGEPVGTEGPVLHDPVGLVVPGMAFGYRADGLGGYLRYEMTARSTGEAGVLASVADLAGRHGTVAAASAPTVVDGLEVLVRAGAHDGFCSFLAWVPEARVGVTVLSNRAGTDVDSVGWEALRRGLTERRAGVGAVSRSEGSAAAPPSRR